MGSMKECADNLKLWDSVSTTDVEYTKKVAQRGGYTSIDATYQAMKATEQFGVYGQGWGLKSIEYNFNLIQQTRLVICSAVFFYTIDGKEHSFPINNAISPFLSFKGEEFKPDEDFCKKVETNTISKALSKLGFSADIFMGLFDDMDYVSQIKTEQEIERAEDRDAEIKQKRKEAGAYVVKHLALIESSSSVSEVTGLQKASIRYLTNHQKISVIADICEQGIKKIALESEAKILKIKGAAK